MPTRSGRGSRGGRQGSVTIHQDVNLYAAQFAGDQSVSVEIKAGCACWIQVQPVWCGVESGHILVNTEKSRAKYDHLHARRVVKFGPG